MDQVEACSDYGVLQSTELHCASKGLGVSHLQRLLPKLGNLPHTGRSLTTWPE